MFGNFKKMTNQTIIPALRIWSLITIMIIIMKLKISHHLYHQLHLLKQSSNNHAKQNLTVVKTTSQTKIQKKTLTYFKTKLPKLDQTPSQNTLQLTLLHPQKDIPKILPVLQNTPQKIISIEFNANSKTIGLQFD